MKLLLNALKLVLKQLKKTPALLVDLYMIAVRMSIDMADNLLPGCTIGGRRYPNGDQNPVNNCEVCQMDVSPTSWTPTLIPLRAGMI